MRDYPSRDHCTPVYPEGGSIRKVLTPAFLLLLLIAALPSQSADPTYPISADVQTTRQRTVRPVPLPDELPYVFIAGLDQCGPRGYSSWVYGDPVDAGALLPDGSTPGTSNPTETLLTFFSMSDVHLADKESPAQGIFMGLIGSFGNADLPAYSPVILSTTQVLDAAVQTINVLHGRTPFDFGISLGDDANNTQHNELRWFIGVMDGERITPSSGAHRGANSIDYQRPYQAAGLDKSIPWYQVIGNHDQYWSGALYADDYVRNILVGNTVIDMGFDETGFPSFDARGIYMGVVDGKTAYGTIRGDGAAETMAPWVVAADPKRRSLTTETSTSLNWMKEFFNTTSEPKGHGFTQANLDNDFACYTFEPKASVPLKFIVLDDTCKDNPYPQFSSYAHGCLDQKRYDWLVSELDRGQAEGKLMIIAAHVPVGPQLNVPDAPLVNPVPPATAALPNTTVVPFFFSLCPTCKQGDPLEYYTPVPPYTVVNDAMLLGTLHNYSNLILWMSGHRHINTVTPQPAPAGTGPQFGFWEVETPSLRDFPQQFRTFQIVRNDNNTLSIFITDVDPAVQDDSPAGKSRGYALGAARINLGLSTTPSGLADTTPHVYNAELIKPLPAPYTLTVSVTGPGSVVSSPYSGINTAAGTMSADYLPGTQVTLVAIPEPGAAFAGWTTCAGQSACTMTMYGDIDVTASFTSQPTLAVSPSYLDFRNVKIGEKAGATFTVKNTATQGLADLIMGTISISGTPAGQFRLLSGKDHCSGQTLGPGMSRTFRVSFAPTSPNTKVATVSIPYNSSPPNTPAVIPLTGVGK